MKWIVNASIINVVQAETASDASDWVMAELAEKFGMEFINHAIIRASLVEEEHDANV